MTMRISIIVAMSENRVIGRNNALPWHLPADLKRFRALTMGHSLIMGRKTFDSIGKPLPGRRSIVITRQPVWSAPGIEVAHGLDQAINMARSADETEAFIIGGEQVFRLAMPLVKRILLTMVHTTIPDGDAYFPEFDLQQWCGEPSQTFSADAANPTAHTFTTLTHR